MILITTPWESPADIRYDIADNCRNRASYHHEFIADRLCCDRISALGRGCRPGGLLSVGGRKRDGPLLDLSTWKIVLTDDTIGEVEKWLNNTYSLGVL